MQMLDTGELQTLAGYSILDPGNAPIVLDPNAGLPKISRDGMISQSGSNVAALGLFAIDTTKGYARHDNAAIIPAKPGSLMPAGPNDGIVQGFVEESNVNPITEMTKLIAVTRAFEALQSSTEDTEASLKRAIQVLGGA